MMRPSGGRKRAALVLDIVVQSRRWSAQRGAKATVRRAIEAAAKAAQTGAAEVVVLLTNDAAVRTLNRTWRGKDAPTNVLSFPAGTRHPGQRHHLGNIAIAYETTAREAKDQGKPFRDHLAHLAVHGFLHLAGHDHEAENEARDMENLEIAILRRLKVPNPYIAQGDKG